MAKKNEPKKIKYYRVLTVWNNGQQLTLAARTPAQAERMVRELEDLVSLVTGGAARLAAQEVTQLSTYADPTAWPFRCAETHVARRWPAEGLARVGEEIDTGAGIDFFSDYRDAEEIEREQLATRLGAKAKVSEKRAARRGERTFPTAEEMERLDNEARARVADLNRENIEGMKRALERDTWETSMVRAKEMRRRQGLEE